MIAPERMPYREQKTYLVDGKLVEWKGPVQEVSSPMSVKTLGSYPLMTAKESLEALNAAVKAYNNGTGLWPTMPAQDRIDYVLRFVEAMKSKRDEVVELLMWEIGKTLPDSQKEFDRTVQYILDTVEAYKNLDRDSSRFVIQEGVAAQIRRAPLGVTLCMGPFNYPLNEGLTTVIPSLLMGNVVIFKPPKFGVLLFEPLLRALHIFPAGVVNTIYGDGAEIISPLMASGKIDVLAFIGSTKVADILRKQHPAPHRLKCVLGLGAKNVGIILPDADLDNAVKECTAGALSFNGQRCTALKILFVHDTIHDVFVEGLKKAVGALKAGMPWEEGVSLTPLPEPGKVAYLTGLLDDAMNKGASANLPHGEEGAKGMTETFFYPVILTGVTKEMRIWHEEQFGPIIPIVRYGMPNEKSSSSKIWFRIPETYVQESNFGQQVSIFGKDPTIIARLIDSLVNQVCRVNINSQCQRGPDTFPFTGRKDSAEGTLSVTDALRVFSIRTMVAAKMSNQNQILFNSILKERKSAFLSTDFLF